MASFEDQINEIDQFIVRAAQSRDLLQRRLDAEAEDILQLADWNATIENIEAMDQRSAEHTATTPTHPAELARLLSFACTRVSV